MSSRGIKFLRRQRWLPPCSTCLDYLYRGMTYQTRLIGASHVSVFNWVHALRGIVSRVPRRERKIVAIDETKLKIQGRQVYVWAAIDADTKELLAGLCLRPDRSEHQHDRLPEEGPRDVHRQEAGGARGRWALVHVAPRRDGLHGARDVRLQKLHREVLPGLEGETRRFYNNLPSTRMDNLQSFMDVFMLWYNHLRRHQGLGRTPVEVMPS